MLNYCFYLQIIYRPLPQQVTADSINYCRFYFQAPYFKQPVLNPTLDNLTAFIIV